MKIGDLAPVFKGFTTSNQEFDLSDNKGKWIVLYFYPKDDTSGCTKEASGFRDNMQRISTYNAEIVGVSPDSVKSHDKFKEKYMLNFTIVSDPEKTICNLYGVIGEKSMYGKKYLGVNRSTFIINPEGVISYLWEKVKVDGHVEEVINKLQELQN